MATPGLGDYYAEKGESPGRWWGAGLAGLDVEAGSEVTEEQMRNLFGEGRHPDAERLEDAALDAGSAACAAAEGLAAGSARSRCYAGNAPEFVQETARRFTAYNYEHGNALEGAGPGRGAGPDPHRGGRRDVHRASTAGRRSMTGNAPASWRGRPGSRPRRSPATT